MDAPQWIICVENPFHKACFVNKCGDDIRHCVSESTSMRPKYLDPSHSKRDVSLNFDLMLVIFVVRSRSAGSFGRSEHICQDFKNGHPQKDGESLTHSNSSNEICRQIFVTETNG